MPPDRLIADLQPALCAASRTVTACRAAVSIVGRHAPTALVAVLLHVRDHLRCVAATGSWHVYSSVRPDRGVVGRVFTTGRTAVVTDVADNPEYIPLGPNVTVEICAPLTDPAGRPVGVFNVEFTSPVDAVRWCPLIEEVAARLAARIARLGGPPAESQSEQLLRHALAITAAGDEAQLVERSMEAAREVSGLPAAVLLLPTPAGVRAYRAAGPVGGFADRVGRHLAAFPPEVLDRLMHRARGYGSSYTLGDPAELDAEGFEDLTSVGVRTMIAVPTGPPDAGGVLLVLDHRASIPSPATVNLLELLNSHAWNAVERLRTVRGLRERASSDPLTGLRHHGPFGERLSTATPGRTALLAIDVDSFKTVNDTYGHQVGDRVLVNLARSLQGALREADDLYRIGGDEFVAVIEIHRPDEGRRVAERLRQAARDIGRTISIGVAVQEDSETPEMTLRRADAALYEAKRTGRDRVRVAG